MGFDLMLKPSCSGCGSTHNLYGSNRKHMTLCFTCGKTMAEKQGKCSECGAIVTRLIREYNVRASPTYSTDKKYFIGRFTSGLPNFSKKKSPENKWTLQKEGRSQQLITDTILREKFKNKPWVLEDETGQAQYQGNLEGSVLQCGTNYYLLVMQGKEFVAIPVDSWYKFNKVAQYKQLTLEEAEEKLNKRRKTENGFGRWMMKEANDGASAFGQVEINIDDKERKKWRTGGYDEGNVLDVEGEKILIDDDEEGLKGGDVDMDDDDDGGGGDDDGIEKGDDWEHEEIFTDDDEAVGGDDHEEMDLALELVPVPLETKEEEEEEEGLSQSGKELKKLLGKSGLNESDAEDDDVTFNQVVLAPN